MISRRKFIGASAFTAVGLSSAMKLAGAFTFDDTSPSELHNLCNQLLHEWSKSLLSLQVTDRSNTLQYGGIFCPADKIVHGRTGDAIYPLLHLAHTDHNSACLDAAMLLYQWMEREVSQPDGSWLNEPVAGSWKGTTVFAAIALAEAIKHHGLVLDNSIKKQMETRLVRAGNFIYDNFSYQYGNINYPVTAAYGMSLLGEVLDMPKFRQRGKTWAQEALPYFTKKDGLLYGEGDLSKDHSPKRCMAIDLGYNIEESLPALVQYGLMNKDAELLEILTHSMQQHLEFMLPDGGWDNSWGTRNYKWTYWGSRTSDGCQTAYALLADRDPRFYKAALLNTRLFQACTANGLLTGGPHYAVHGVTPCVHHTFSHMKALTAVLDHGSKITKGALNSVLPREETYGTRFFSDIQTWLVSTGKFRATVTAYDKEYKKTKNGHASGGALSMLWHETAGPLLCASMNEYQLYEAGNMQRDTDPFSIPLTPRIELKTGNAVYMNISDLSATVVVKKNGNDIIIHSRSRLVDKDQRDPAAGTIHCTASYTFTANKVILAFTHDNTSNEQEVRIVIPVISPSTEKPVIVSGKRIDIIKKNCKVMISSDRPISQLPSANGRVFNYVPGFEAVPFVVMGNKVAIEIAVV